MPATPHIVIIGAGAGGLSAACDLAGRGAAVTVVESGPCEGGKMRQLEAGGHQIDAGPTVFTMRWVFEALFADNGASFSEALATRPSRIIARHGWTDGSRLDLCADAGESADAIGRFAGNREAGAYRRFVRESRAVHDTLRDTFMSAEKPTPLSLATRIGDPAALFALQPFSTYARALARSFSDPRLRQLFGRYATYVGSSPYAAPATLMLIAHVEQEGVWLPEGGMRALAAAMRKLAETNGARFRTNAPVRRICVVHGKVSGVELETGEQLAAAAVVFNGDVSALGSGLLGKAVQGAARATPRRSRSLSAITWCVTARTAGFDLDYHNVFFLAGGYAREFDTIFRERRISAGPTVYVCAQDRGQSRSPHGPERLLVLINAPADGDLTDFIYADAGPCEARVLALLSACGLEIEGGLEGAVATTPAGFSELFPGTGGALYGAANHSPFASFTRPGCTSRIPGLYLAGGSVHPGAGVPMATLSGRIAAARIIRDLNI